MLMQVYLQLQEPHSTQMKALRSSLEKARELKLNNQAKDGSAGGADKSQQQMIMERYQKCATLKVSLKLHSTCDSASVTDGGGCSVMYVLLYIAAAA